MIFIRNIRDSKGDFDEVWGIVRSLKSVASYMKQVPELSPSISLFSWYRQQVNNGTWSKELFKTEYVPRFIQEFTEEGKQKLKELRLLDLQNKNICLFCFCSDENMCHRSIIAGILQGMNVNVSASKDYSFYYKQFLAIHGKHKEE